MYSFAFISDNPSFRTNASDQTNFKHTASASAKIQIEHVASGSAANTKKGTVVYHVVSISPKGLGRYAVQVCISEPEVKHSLTLARCEQFEARNGDASALLIVKFPPSSDVKATSNSCRLQSYLKENLKLVLARRW